MSKAMMTYESAPAAYLPQFNRTAAGSIARAVKLTATGQVETGPKVVYGFKVITPGTAGSFVAYDATAATAGTEVTETLAFGALTAGQTITVGPAGVGVLTDTALFVTLPTGAVVRTLLA